MYYDYKSPIAIRGEGNFKLRLTFAVNEAFRESTLRHFILANPRIKHCIKLNKGKSYALFVHLCYKQDFNVFRCELIDSVPGITTVNTGVVGSILKR